MNVLLVKHPYDGESELHDEILLEIRALRKGIRCRTVFDVDPKPKHFLWSLGLKTHVISFRPLEKFKPSWAQLWQQHNIGKAEEYSILDKAGVPVPKWTALREGEEFNPEGFDEFVVVKPANGAFGAMVRISKRENVRWRPLEVARRGLVSEALIVQQYHHTGPWPENYRVGTVFGEPYYAWKNASDRGRSAFPEGKKDSQFFAGRSIVASSRGCRLEFNVPDEAIELAKRAHAAFPDVPLLGTDIVRDCETGKFYVVECNVSGGTFHISNSIYKRIMAETNIDVRAQFGGSKAVARGIVRRLNASFDSLSQKEAA